MMVFLACSSVMIVTDGFFIIIVELRWLEPLWDHENLFETAVVRALEGY